MSMTFRTFDVTGSRVGRAHAQGLAEKLQSFRFTGLGSAAEGQAAGWVGPEHVLDADFSLAHVLHGPFLCFGYRVDRRKVPGDLLAAHVALELAAWQKDNDGKRVPKKERARIKTDAKKRLLEETPATSKATPCWWDLSEGRLYVGSASKATEEGVRGLLDRTFADDGKSLAPVVGTRSRVPKILADHVVDVLRVAFGLPEVDARLRETKPLRLFGGEAVAESPDFLGREFLTWLWFRGETCSAVDVLKIAARSAHGSRAHRLAVQSVGGEVTVFVNDSLSFVSSDKKDTTVSVSHGAPTVRPEATAALRAGLTLRKAKLTIARGPNLWSFTLDGETFDVSGLKTSRPMKVTEERGEKNLFEEGAADSTDGDDVETAAVAKKAQREAEGEDAKSDRLGEAADLRETIDALFATFLETRLSPVAWPEVERAMRRWVLDKESKAALAETAALEERSRDLFEKLEEKHPRAAAAVGLALSEPDGVAKVEAALAVVQGRAP